MKAFNDKINYSMKTNTSIAKAFRAFNNSLSDKEISYIGGREAARDMFWQALRHDDQLAYISLVDLRVLCFDVSDDVSEIIDYMEEVENEWLLEKETLKNLVKKGSQL
jgi:hypothetical protein